MQIQKSMGERALYAPYRIPGSKLRFRGPETPREGDYIAYLGGSETFGKFVELPFPDRTEEACQIPAVNLGCVNAGIDVFLHDPKVLAICQQAQATILQVMGAQNLSNRFYTVHPRRNDRFINASSLLRVVYDEVEFTDIHFTRHLLTVLMNVSAVRFQVLREELQEAWLARMKLLIETITTPVVLLHLETQTAAGDTAESILGPDPLFVTEKMLEALRPFVSDIIHVDMNKGDGLSSLKGKVYTPVERSVAQMMPGPDAHAAIAKSLAIPLLRLNEKGPRDGGPLTF